MLQRHRVLLERVSKIYGVPAPVIVALWGIESNFGLTGPEPTVPVLTTTSLGPAPRRCLPSGTLTGTDAPTGFELRWQVPIVEQPLRLDLAVNPFRLAKSS